MAMTDIVNRASRAYWNIYEDRRSRKKDSQRLMILSLLQGMQSMSNAAMTISNTLQNIKAEERAEKRHEIATAEAAQRGLESIEKANRERLLAELQHRIYEANPKTFGEHKETLDNFIADNPNAWNDDVVASALEGERKRAELQFSVREKTEDVAAKTRHAELTKFHTAGGFAKEVQQQIPAIRLNAEREGRIISDDEATILALQSTILQPGATQWLDTSLPDDKLLQTSREAVLRVAGGTTTRGHEVEALAINALKDSPLTYKQFDQTHFADLVRANPVRYAWLGALVNKQGQPDKDRIQGAMSLALSQDLHDNQLRLVANAEEKAQRQWVERRVDAALRMAPSERLIEGVPISRVTEGTRRMMHTAGDLFATYMPGVATALHDAAERDVSGEFLTLKPELAKRVNAWNRLGLDLPGVETVKPVAQTPGTWVDPFTGAEFPTGEPTTTPRPLYGFEPTTKPKPLYRFGSKVYPTLEEAKKAEQFHIEHHITREQAIAALLKKLRQLKEENKRNRTPISPLRYGP